MSLDLFAIDFWIFIYFLIKDAEEMDKADEELKETVKHLWPLQSVKKLDLVVPPKERKY